MTSKENNEVAEASSDSLASGYSEAADLEGWIGRRVTTPLFEAQHAARYSRQDLIRRYQESFNCRLVVLYDEIRPDGVVYFEDLLFDCRPSEDLHVVLETHGGDEEAAIRLVRQAQAHCRELTVIVPEQAKSAGTLFALGAHRILMGPTSDLGPVDPQLWIAADDDYWPAKLLIAAYEQAAEAVRTDPDTYPFHAMLLADVRAIEIQAARDAIADSPRAVRQAVSANPARSESKVEELSKVLNEKLVEESLYHAATLPATTARDYGLPVEALEPSSRQWQMIWRLWMRYRMESFSAAYESDRASQLFYEEDASQEQNGDASSSD